MMKTLRFLLTFITICAFTISMAQSQVINSYRSIQSGDWNTVATWQRFDGNNWISATAVPSSADEGITIREGHTVTVSDARTVDQTVVEAGGTLLVSGGILSVNDGVGVDLTIDGTWNWNSGQVSGPGTIDIREEGIFNLSTGGTKIFITTPGIVNNNGTMNWSDGFVAFNNNFTINNNSNFNILAGAGQQFSNNGGTCTFNNYGVTTKNVAGSSLFNVNFINKAQGIFNLGQGSLSNNTLFINEGEINLSAGTTFTSAGTFNHNEASKLSGTGLFSQIGGLGNVNGDVIFNSGVVFTLAGNLTVASGKKLTIDGTWNWHSGQVSGPGTIDISEGALFNLATGGTKIFITTPGILNNNGTMNWSDGFVAFNNSFTINNIGIFNIIAGGGQQFSNNGGICTFNNTGITTRSGTGNAILGVNFSNQSEGILNINQGMLSNNTQFTNWGVVNFSTGTSLTTTGTVHHNEGSTLSGTGLFNQTGISTINGDVNFGHGITFTLAGNLTVGTGGTLTIDGTWNWNSGQLSGPGTIDIGEEAIFNLATNGTKIFITTPGIVNNKGTMNWSDGFVAFNNNYTINNYGNFNISAASGQQFSNNGGICTFNNSGKTTKTSLGIANLNVLLNNTGTISGIGTLNFQSSFINSGVISPGISPGILTINGLQPLGASSTLEIEILDNSGPGTGHDQLAREGALTLAGTLNVSEIGNVPGDSYTIVQLSSGAISGNFSAINLPEGYSLETTSNAIILTKTVDPCENTPVPVIIADITETCLEGTVLLSTTEAASYLWSNGATTQSVDVGPGEYTVSTTDENGCTTISEPVVINAVDTEAPVIPEIPDLEISTDTDACSAIEVILTIPEATDNCGIASLTNDAPEEFPLGTTVVTWTAIDATGNLTTRSFNVIVKDNQSPVITAPANINIQIDESEESATDVELGAPSTSDNCGVENVGNDAPESFPIGTTTVIWTVIDDSGNTATAEQTVTVTKEILPTITAPANITVNNNEGICGATGIDLGSPAVTGEDIPSDGVSNNAPASFPVGTTTVIWTVTDGNGNTATAQQSVTVTDEENPVIAPVAIITRSNDPGSCDAEIEIDAPAVSDNCDNPTATGTRSDGLALNAPYPVGSTQITWAASDAAGNESDEVVQTVTVTDTEAPEITAPANISIQVGESEESATDVDLGTPSTSDNCGVEEVSNDALTTFPVGTTTVIWTVTDVNGNTATANQTVTVTREVLPTITAPANITVNNNEGICGATGIDLGSPAVTGEDIPSDGISNNAPASFPVGTTTVIWTVTDGNGNTAAAQQSVTVTDEENPVIAPVAIITRSNDPGSCDAEIEIDTPAVSDNCDNPTATGTRSDGLALDAPYPVGITLITWSATDASGNEAEKVIQTVTVSDIEIPIIAETSPVSHPTDEGICEAVISITPPVVIDNCDLLIAPTGIRSDGRPLSDSYPVGLTTITWTAMDEAGNSALEVVQPITIEDTEMPTAIAKNIEIEIGLLETISLTPEEVDNGSSDNCGSISKSLSKIVFTESDEGANLVTLTVTDDSGNTSTATATVTVIVNRLCNVIAIAKDVTLYLDVNGTATLNSNEVDNGSYSECTDGNLTFILDQTDFTCEDLGSRQGILTVIDQVGTQSTATFNLTVVDNIPPRIRKVPKTINVFIAEGGSYILPDFTILYPSDDNCSVLTYLQTLSPGTSLSIAGKYPVTLTAIDQSGNQVTAIININIRISKAKGGGIPTAGFIDTNSILSVKWNSEFHEISNYSFKSSDENGVERELKVKWDGSNYDPLTPGLYQIEGVLNEKDDLKLAEKFTMNVFVQNKPLANDITLEFNMIPKNVVNGQVIGFINTIDPSDNIHSYRMNEHPNLYIEGKQLIWKSNGQSDAIMNITVHSTDRAGQTISRELTLYREVDPNSILVYPNPATTESNIRVQLSGESEVTIRIFDAVGRTVYEEQGRQSETFDRNINLRALSSGLYHIVVQIDNRVFTGRLVKDL